jgi:hypothetical protein
MKLSIYREFENIFNFYKYSNRSFSQEGEDQILERLLDSNSIGFYIDIGAHHPMRFSNTYKFYLKGWRGINIDAMPGSMTLFEKYRPRDINLEVPISSKKEVLLYHVFNEPALNTFSKVEAEKKRGIQGYSITGTKELVTETLADILPRYIDVKQKIDFMSIDVEGLDLDVLISNNWSDYKPNIILVEELKRSSDLLLNRSEINKFLVDLGYKFVARTVNTSFYSLVHE